MPVKSVNKSEQFSVGVGYAMAKNTIAFSGAPFETDSDATVIDVRATVYQNIFLTASYADIKTDIPTFCGEGGGPVPGPSSIDINTMSFGFGTKIAAGNGNIELAYAYSTVEFEIESAEIKQNIFKAGYSVDVGNGLNVGLTLIYYSNGDFENGPQGGVDDVFAPVFTVGYKFGQGFSADLSYSTENTAFGAPDADGTTTVGVRYGF
jgi:predicted porin